MMLFCVRPGQARLACIELALSHVKDPSSNFFALLAFAAAAHLILSVSVKGNQGSSSRASWEMWGDYSYFHSHPRLSHSRDLGSFNILQRAHQKRITASSVANSPMVSTDHDAMSDGDHHL